jgi:hypothetical protein
VAPRGEAVNERESGMSKRVLFELVVILIGFGAPLVALIAFDLATRESPLSLALRMRTLEDTCSYGICFILPLFIYLPLRVALHRRILARIRRQP